MALGGGSSAAEIFVSFLYRYSNLDSQKEGLDERAKTKMSESTVIRCDGGEANLATGVKIDRCTNLFGICFQRIMQRLEQQCYGYNVSIIGSIIDCIKLESSRKISLGMAAQLKRIHRSRNNSASTYYSSHEDPNKAVAGKKVNFTFSKFGATKATSDDIHKDLEPKRGPHGGLIPIRRPDVEAKPRGVKALFLRGGKFRKNKKKQKRDAALNDFVKAW